MAQPRKEWSFVKERLMECRLAHDFVIGYVGVLTLYNLSLPPLDFDTQPI